MIPIYQLSTPIIIELGKRGINILPRHKPQVSIDTSVLALLIEIGSLPRHVLVLVSKIRAEKAALVGA